MKATNTAEQAAMRRAYEETRAHYASGAPLASDGWHCVYLATTGSDGIPLGAQCALGCRISNGLAALAGGWDRLNDLGSIAGLYYEPVMAELFGPIFGKWNSPLWHLNAEIQLAHDRSFNPEEFLSSLDEIARTFGLLTA